jgi:hypothetical protein
MLPSCHAQFQIALDHTLTSVEVKPRGNKTAIYQSQEKSAAGYVNK